MKQGKLNAYRRPLIYLLAVVIIIAIVPTATFADTDIYGGSCGDNLIWQLNVNNGYLGIFVTNGATGTCAMTDYDSGSAPWYSY